MVSWLPDKCRMFLRVWHYIIENDSNSHQFRSRSQRDFFGFNLNSTICIVRIFKACPCCSFVLCALGCFRYSFLWVRARTWKGEERALNEQKTWQIRFAFPLEISDRTIFLDSWVVLRARSDISFRPRRSVLFPTLLLRLAIAAFFPFNLLFSLITRTRGRAFLINYAENKTELATCARSIKQNAAY